jgi:hypothetical protein|tara:strand:+ start:581 stop:1096 length:516 start_codon:yes stop_codon:yes gene_type:complete
MKKKVKIFGKEIKRATRRKLMENVMENWEMKDTYSKKKYKQTPREGGIENVFGQYAEDMDPAVIRYMRKNPDAILRRMAKLYPEIYMRHLPEQSPVMDDWEFDVEEEMVDETYYGFENSGDIPNNFKPEKDDTVKVGSNAVKTESKIKSVTVNEIKKILGRRLKNKNQRRG